MAVPLDDVRPQFSTVEDAIDEIANGRPVVVVDDPDRENEGDLIFAASLATPEVVAFCVRHTSGVLCTALDAHTCDRLQLPLMVPAGDGSATCCVGSAPGVLKANRFARSKMLLCNINRQSGTAEIWPSARPGEHQALSSCRRDGTLLRINGDKRAGVLDDDDVSAMPARQDLRTRMHRRR
jgi:hypothetical protein